MAIAMEYGYARGRSSEKREDGQMVIDELRDAVAEARAAIVKAWDALAKAQENLKPDSERSGHDLDADDLKRIVKRLSHVGRGA